MTFLKFDIPDHIFTPDQINQIGKQIDAMLSKTIEARRKEIGTPEQAILEKVHAVLVKWIGGEPPDVTQVYDMDMLYCTVNLAKLMEALGGEWQALVHRVEAFRKERKEILDKIVQGPKEARDTYELLDREEYCCPQCCSSLWTNALGEVWCSMKGGLTLKEDTCDYARGKLDDEMKRVNVLAAKAAAKAAKSSQARAPTEIIQGAFPKGT